MVLINNLLDVLEQFHSHYYDHRLYVALAVAEALSNHTNNCFHVQVESLVFEFLME